MFQTRWVDKQHGVLTACKLSVALQLLSSGGWAADSSGAASWLHPQEVRQARKNYDRLMAKMASLVEYSEVRAHPVHACAQLPLSPSARLSEPLLQRHRGEQQK